MLSLACSHELRSIARSPASVVAIVSFLLVGALAIAVGERHVAGWEDAIATARDAQATSVEQARETLARGARAPADTPRADLTQAHWQDRYAASRLARSPGPLAGIAAGAVDSAPAAFHVHWRADPLSAGGYRIENPELTAGAIDLVFVLAVLLPLLIGVLGMGIGTRERESGLEPLIVIQAGSPRGWIVSRTIVVTGIAAAAAALLCLAAAGRGGAGPKDIAALLAFAVAYAGLWGGVMLAINARARTVRAAAFSFGALWMLLCVLVPALANEVALSEVEEDFAVATTVDAREQQWEILDSPIDQVLPAFYTLYPDLERLPAQARLSRMDGHYIRGAVNASLTARLQARELEQQAEAARLTETTAWLSPTIALSLGSERLAGVGADAGRAYRAAIGDAVQARVDLVTERAWERRALDADDFEAMVASTPDAFRAQPERLAAPLVMLATWMIAAWGVGLVLLRQRGLSAR